MRLALAALPWLLVALGTARAEEAPVEGADPALVAALTSPRASAREEALHRLAGDPSAARPLARALVRHEEPLHRRAGWRLLGRVGGPEDLDRSASGLADPVTAVATEAGHALVALAARLPPRHPPPLPAGTGRGRVAVALAPALRRALEGVPPGDVPAVLGRLGEGVTESLALLAASRRGGEMLRARALAALGRVGGDGARTVLAARAAEEDPGPLDALFEALAEAGAPPEPCLYALASEQLHVRRGWRSRGGVLAFLAAFPPPRDLRPVIRRALHAQLARRWLSASGALDVGQALLACGPCDDAELESLIDALLRGRRGPVLFDGQVASLRVLEGVRTRPVVRLALEEALEEIEDPRRDALLVIGWLLRESAADERALERLAAEILRGEGEDTTAEARRLAVYVLDRLDRPPAAPQVALAWEDTDPWVRAHALRWAAAGEPSTLLAAMVAEATGHRASTVLRLEALALGLAGPDEAALALEHVVGGSRGERARAARALASGPLAGAPTALRRRLEAAAGPMGVDARLALVHDLALCLARSR